jgi:hypothetical protein
LFTRGVSASRQHALRDPLIFRAHSSGMFRATRFRRTVHPLVHALGPRDSVVSHLSGPGCNPNSRVGTSDEREPQELPSPPSVHGALLLVDFELQLIFHKASNARHDPLFRTPTVDANATIISVTSEPAASPLEFPVESVQHDASKQKAKRAALRRTLPASYTHAV